MSDVEQRAIRELLDEWDLPESASAAVADTYAFRQRCLRIALLDLGDSLYEALPGPVRRLMQRIKGEEER